jgi:hypothetical protein
MTMIESERVVSSDLLVLAVVVLKKCARHVLRQKETTLMSSILSSRFGTPVHVPVPVRRPRHLPSHLREGRQQHRTGWHWNSMWHMEQTL